MSGFNLFNRLRSARNSQSMTRNRTKKTGCNDRDVSLRLLVKHSGDSKNDGTKESNVTKYFLKGMHIDA